MSADVITTCPNCLSRELREYWDLYCVSDAGEVVHDTEEPPVRPATYTAVITLNCHSCTYRAELTMSAPMLNEAP